MFFGGKGAKRLTNFSWMSKIGIALALNLLFQHPIILEEEKFCSETYGKTYDGYKKKTKRYAGIQPGPINRPVS